MNRMMMVMVAAIAVLSVFSGIGPVSMKVWFIEMIWAWGLVGVLALTWTKFRFSMMSYSCFFVWCVLQIIGAELLKACPSRWICADRADCFTRSAVRHHCIHMGVMRMCRMKKERNPNLGNILRIGAVAVPWLCRSAGVRPCREVGFLEK